MNHPLPFTRTEQTHIVSSSQVPRFMSGLEMLRETPAVQWRLKDFLLYQGLTAVFSKPGVGKTHFVIGLLFHIAHGIPLLDADIAPCTVCYVSGEGNSGVRDRYEALLKHHKIEASSDNSMLFTDGPTELASQEAVQGFVNGLYEKLAGRDVGVIVIDTLARNFTGDENDAASMKRLIAACDQLVKIFECLVILVHHSNKSSNAEMRGSSVLEGALDTIYAVEKSKTGLDIVVKKQKYGPESARLKCSFEKVTLLGQSGHLPHAVPIVTFDSLEFPTADLSSTEPKKETLGVNQEIALSLLSERPRTETEWKFMFIASKDAPPEKAVRAFREAFATLKYRKIVKLVEDKYTIA